MKELTREEFESVTPTPVKSIVGPIIYEVTKRFKEKPDLMFLEIEPEDLPEEQRFRFESSANLQNLAGLFRIRISPLDDLRVSVRNGRLFICRGKKPRNANKIRS